MRKFFAVMLITLTLMGCATIDGKQFVSCEEAQAYIEAIDSTLAAMPLDSEEAQLARSWYAVAKAGAVTYMARQCVK